MGEVCKYVSKEVSRMDKNSKYCRVKDKALMENYVPRCLDFEALIVSFY